MRQLIMLVFFGFTFYGSQANSNAAENVQFITLPLHKQVYPRNIKTNTGNAVIKGTVSNNAYSSIRIKKYRENVLQQQYDQSLDLSGNAAPFLFNISIKAELANYRLEVFGVNNNDEVLLETADSLLAGEAFIIQGQSNAVAGRFGGFPSNPENQSSFIRVWGSASGGYRKNWYTANGDVDQYVNGNAGQWGLRLARLLMDKEKIPIVIFNGANGGQPIDYFQKGLPGHYKQLFVLKTKGG